MCGITGYWQEPGLDQHSMRAIVQGMTTTLEHRGPDDADVWADEATGLALGFRRLAIVDLSPLGRQPMASPSGRYIIVFNGEVYNYRTLRWQLETEGYRSFRGGSDTEVMVTAIEAWGLEAAVKRFVGMFAFALWDRQERCLHLVRDRLGIKPLYYGWQGSVLLFGSELKALLAYPGFRPEIDPGAVSLYMLHNYVPTPLSIFRGIAKLPAGTILTVPEQRADHVKPQPYWSVQQIAAAGLAEPFEGSDREAIERLDLLLQEAVRLRMIADVPLGAFLSGGVDSSTVVALMQINSGQPIKTFSIGFHEAHYNEATYAAAVARHLRTDHTEVYITPSEAQAVIPRLPQMYDEPFGDASQIPTYLVSALARRSVTVSLSGDGGDELFGGYRRYFDANRIWRQIGSIPRPVRTMSAHLIAAGLADQWKAGLRPLKAILPSYLQRRVSRERLHLLAGALRAPTGDDFYLEMVNYWRRRDQVMCDPTEGTPLSADRAQWAIGSNYFQRMMWYDMITYLPDDILTKVDRASMAVSLEARVPLLDHRVVEFAASLPFSLKVRDHQGKWLLRQVLYQYVPQELIERPKMGFAVPIDAWLRGPLRDWAEALLDERRLHQEGIFNPGPIRWRWQEHLARHRDWQFRLWTVLQFQAWRERLPTSVAAGPGQPGIIRSTGPIHIDDAIQPPVATGQPPLPISGSEDLVGQSQ